MKLDEIRTNLLRIVGTGVEVEDILISDPLPLLEPTETENTYVVGTVIQAGEPVGEITYQYYRPHYSREYVSLEIKYESEVQKIKDVVCPYLDDHFGIQGTKDLWRPEEDITIGEFLNPYSPIIRFAVGLSGYDYTLNVMVILIPEKYDVKYLCNDAIALVGKDSKDATIITHADRLKDEDTTPLWKLIDDLVFTDEEKD